MNPCRKASVIFGTLLGLGACTAFALPLHAAEDVTLKNGFDLVCDHWQEIAGRVRLYTGSGEDNFLEVDASQIAAVKNVPEIRIAPANQSSAKPGPRSGSELNFAHSMKAVPAELTPESLSELVATAGGEHNIDVDLLNSVVRAESGGNMLAVSRAGAQGLMQLMPRTAVQLGVADSFRPDENIDGGAAYLDALLTRYHENLALALAAYNAGPAAVDRYRGVPPYRETRVYVARVIREFNRRKEAEMLRQAASGSRNPRRHGEDTAIASRAAAAVVNQSTSTLRPAD